MDPNNPNGAPHQDFPAPAAQAPQPGHYDFITNPSKSPKKSLLGGGRGGTLIIIAGGVGLFAVILLIGSLFFGGGGGSKEALLNVAQKQSEVIAVANLGAEDGGTNQAQSLALAVQLSVRTEQQALVAQIGKSEKIKPKDYTRGPSSEVTKELETAQRNGRFDEVFANVIKEELTEYQQELRTATAATKSKSTKTILAKDFENASLLLQIPSN
jgi:hypothetical protein